MKIQLWKTLKLWKLQITRIKSENCVKHTIKAKRQKMWETKIITNYRIRENVKIVENTKSVRNTPKITILISNVGIWLRSEYCKWKSETFLSNFYTL